MSPIRGHRAGRDLHGHLGPGADLPRTHIPAPGHGHGPGRDPVYSRRCMRAGRPPTPPQVVFSPALECWFCCAGRAQGCCQEWGPLFQLPVPVFSWGPVTRGAQWESEVQVAQRGWRRPGAIVCGRADRSGAPLGQISLPKSPAGGAEGRPSGWLGMAAFARRGGLLCTGVWACPSEGCPVDSGSPEAAAGGPARPPELTAPPTPGLVQPGAPGQSLKLRGCCK